MKKTIFKKEYTITASDFQFEVARVDDLTATITSNRSLLNTQLWLAIVKNTDEGGTIYRMRYFTTIGATGDVSITDGISGTYNDAHRMITVSFESNNMSVLPGYYGWSEITPSLYQFDPVVVETADLKTKITEMETILKNHYDALMLLLQKHDMVDSNPGDGSSVTPE